jgi:hypothetical protein
MKRFQIPPSVLPVQERRTRQNSDQLLYREHFLWPERKVRKYGAERSLQDLYEREPALARYIEQSMAALFAPLTSERL